MGTRCFGCDGRRAKSAWGKRFAPTPLRGGKPGGRALAISKSRSQMRDCFGVRRCGPVGRLLRTPSGPAQQTQAVESDQDGAALVPEDPKWERQGPDEVPCDEPHDGSGRQDEVLHDGGPGRLGQS